MDNRIDNNADEREHPKSFVERQEKNILVGLGVFSVFVIFLAFFQMYYSLSFPLERSKAQVAQQREQQVQDVYLPGENGSVDLDLKARDTDKDGLNDYDELNIYNTSPYLDDSDSDGVNDKKEIQDGTDPNCPAGKNCSPSVVSEPTTFSDGAALSDEILGGSLSADELRSYLLTSGVAPEEVDALSDDQIMQLYQETLSQIAQ